MKKSNMKRLQQKISAYDNDKVVQMENQLKYIEGQKWEVMSTMEGYNIGRYSEQAK